LDAVKVADYVVFLLSAEVEVDSFGDLILLCIQHQGVPTMINGVQKLGNTGKKASLVRKSLGSFMADHFPGEDKIFDFENDQVTK